MNKELFDLIYKFIGRSSGTKQDSTYKRDDDFRSGRAIGIMFLDTSSENQEDGGHISYKVIRDESDLLKKCYEYDHLSPRFFRFEEVKVKLIKEQNHAETEREERSKDATH